MKKVLGLGNALVDIMTRLESDEILTQFNLPKGGMQLVDADFANAVLNAAAGLQKQQASGGSAANTIHGLARLGVPAAFIGKVGNDDYGKFFHDDMLNSGIQPMLLTGSAQSGLAVALVSIDSERTFATFLGAAIEMTPADLTPEMFADASIFHIEGYLVQNHDLVREAMKMAKAAGLTISLDLASFNVVEQNFDFLHEMTEKYVDIIFANEEEAKAFTGSEPEDALLKISDKCRIAVVKIGKQGSLIKNQGIVTRIGVIPANPVDTTGAGDMYASGFLYGLSLGLSMNQCGKIGAILAGNVIDVIGAKMTNETWQKMRIEINEIARQ
ncbi:MAG: adenosine kinase [Bacteroidetes bacterium]|nr:adenosine kinase [Bacteroidota bacterium]MBU1717602.1 adenosine kinase [Bacteroidota bacterium]